MAQRKAGRGQLSTLETLPDWCDEAKSAAFTALKERKVPAETILAEFNEAIRNAAQSAGITDGIPKVSRSAFNRASMRQAIAGRRLQETSQIAAVLAPKLDQAGDNSLTLLVAELIKTLAFEMLSNAGELKADGETAEMLSLVGRALNSAEQAKRISADTRKKIEADVAARASKAVDMVAKSKGLTAETVDAIKSKILGMEKPVAKP